MAADEEEDAQDVGQRTLAHVPNALIRRILNVLTEAPYFYREDDPRLFHDLRRRQAAIAKFFDWYFGWELVVEERCARLIKRKRENNALLDSQVDSFQLTRRSAILVFALALEFYELEARRASFDPDKENLRFFYKDFLDHAKRRFRELLGDRTPEDAQLRKNVAEAWDLLQKYRFIRYIRPTAAELADSHESGGGLYEFLPAIALYDSSVLADSEWLSRLKSASQEDAVGSHAADAPGGDSAQEVADGSI
jgi:hypothetical protein